MRVNSKCAEPGPTVITEPKCDSLSDGMSSLVDVGNSTGVDAGAGTTVNDDGCRTMLHLVSGPMNRQDGLAEFAELHGWKCIV